MLGLRVGDDKVSPSTGSRLREQHGTLKSTVIPPQARARTADLNDGWVCEALVEDVHVTSELQGVNNEVFRAGGDLHEAGQS